MNKNKYKYEVGKRLKFYPTKTEPIWKIIHRFEEKGTKSEMYIVIKEDSYDTKTRVIMTGNTIYEPDYLPPNEIVLDKCIGKRILNVELIGRTEAKFTFSDGSELKTELGWVNTGYDGCDDERQLEFSLNKGE